MTVAVRRSLGEFDTVAMMATALAAACVRPCKRRGMGGTGEGNGARIERTWAGVADLPAAVLQVRRGLGC